MTSDGQRQLQFGSDGNLLRVTQPVAREFVYDASDRVVSQTEGSGAKRYRIYAGENILMEYDAQTYRVTEHLYLGSLLIGSRVMKNTAPVF